MSMGGFITPRPSVDACFPDLVSAGFQAFGMLMVCCEQFVSWLFLVNAALGIHCIPKHESQGWVSFYSFVVQRAY